MMIRTHTWRTAWLVLLGAGCLSIGITASPAHATPAQPSIETTIPYSTGATVATLKAQIDPNGQDTTYLFEYGPTASYGTVVPAGGTDIGSGNAVVNVVAPLSGLQPNTVYHYRVVASNAQGVSFSKNETFSTFGLALFEMAAVNEDGTPDVSAGSHPYELRTQIKFTEEGTTGKPAGSDKNLRIELPAGLIGDPQAVPQCPQQVFVEDEVCPADTQIGVIALELQGVGLESIALYNLVPVAGAPAQFGAYAVLAPLRLTAVITPDRADALSIDLQGLNDYLAVKHIAFTLWGVPGEASHDAQRGACLHEKEQTCPVGVVTKPLLTLPTACDSPLTYRLQADAWAQPEAYVSAVSPVPGAGGGVDLVGCEQLDFTPKLSVQSDTTEADSPLGFDMSIDVPQNDQVNGRAEAALKGMVVKLPEGVSVNVSAADGLSGCAMAQIALSSAVAPSCPASSTIGTAEIETPLLPVPVRGSIFLAQPHENPFGSEFAAYVDAETDGVQVKLAMQISPDPNTGQLTVSLDEAPQLEFAGLKLDFKGGARAILASPNSCGTFTTSGQPTSYAEDTPGLQPLVSSQFTIESNCEGGFSPSFAAGSTSPGAGEASGFTLQVGRGDGQQTLGRISATLPPGLLAKLGSVPLCGNADAAAGTCGAASRVGSATIAAGAGSHPFDFTGNVFLTGGYEGAPYGLSIVVPGVAGPFDLGLVVIRAQLLIDRRDAHLTLLTDPLPTIRQGVPLRIRSIDVTVNRPGFIFNPTNCASRQVTADITGTSTNAQVSSPFALTGCARLPFSPTVSASTHAHVSLEQGAALSLKIKQPHGTQANLRGVEIALPAQMSARLTAIRRACLTATFNRDPGACPHGSRIGTGEAQTSLLGELLRGPVYLVSQGRSGRPLLAIVLQGQGIVLELLGTLRIVGKDVTVVTFTTVPDAPISTLGIAMLAGRTSVLGINDLSKESRSECGKKLVLHAALTGQNGLQVRRSVRVSVSGCHTRRAASKRARRSAKRTAQHKRR